jgi:hypothetical protein
MDDLLLNCKVANAYWDVSVVHLDCLELYLNK